MPSTELFFKIGTQILSTMLGVSGLFAFYSSFYDPTGFSAVTAIVLLCPAVALVWAMDTGAGTRC
jgi:hypothetical protein